jgi:hypothetical protein
MKHGTEIKSLSYHNEVLFPKTSQRGTTIKLDRLPLFITHTGDAPRSSASCTSDQGDGYIR